ncbi:Crp/Fnr family transcriptional regulator [uncultured Albimonas sp.]|uniref:Crp/Fnr family transcriptional regulator n=1 Tax=uncultured Albimonas sp. TaxID=1331701 RepID=UPI0030EBC9C3
MTPLSSSRNRLLATLSPQDADLIREALEPVALSVRQRLETPDLPIEHVYFPERGIGSVIAVGRRDRRVESGLFGRDGMSGLSVVLGVDRSPHETFMQVEGVGRRIAAETLRNAMELSPTLRPFLLRYVHVRTVQSAQTGLSNAKFRMHQRLARWLLMCSDRIDEPEMPLTHAFLSVMLGVRRAGVTEAMHDLERQGLIGLNRGSVAVLDRPGLIAAADGSYGLPEAEYARLIG